MFDNRYIFVEYCSVNIFMFVQYLFQLQCSGSFGVDYQYFLRVMVGQVVYQLFNVWIEVLLGGVIIFKFLINMFWVEYIVSMIFCIFMCVYNVGDFNSCLILCRQWQFNGVQFVFREFFYIVMCVMEQYVVGVVAIYQYRNQFLMGVLGIFVVVVCCL